MGSVNAMHTCFKVDEHAYRLYRLAGRKQLAETATSSENI